MSRAKRFSETEQELITDLKAVSGLRWDDHEEFEFGWLPGLAKALNLSDGKDEVDRLRLRLKELVVEVGKHEGTVKPRFNRSLAEAWTVLLGLNEHWAAKDLDERRAHLMKTWRSKRNQPLDSVSGFKVNQEPEIYGPLAKRLLRSADLSAGPTARRKSTPKAMPPVEAAPWPVKGHRPQQGQEIVILIAAHAMRHGPNSGLVKLVREFEPYWRATETMVYSLTGSYKEIWRAGLLHDYEHFAPLPAGSYGGLVHATEVVIAAAEASTPVPCHVVFLIDPHDNSSLYPATASIKRECLLTRTAFLTTYQGAARWFRLEWARRVADERGNGARDLLLPRPKTGFPKDSGLDSEPGVLALAAHDRHKLAMMEFAETSAATLENHFDERWATRVTGHLLNGGSIFDDEYQEDILYDVKGQGRDELMDNIELKTYDWELEDRKRGPGSVGWVRQLTRGRQGGVIQLARRVLKNECDTVLFFQDADTPREHDMEIQVLDRAAQLADSNCLLLYDEQSAARWADNVAVCLDREPNISATTLVEAYRRVFDVELVLAHDDDTEAEPGGSRSHRRTREDTEAIWTRITATAATYVVGALLAAADQRAEYDGPVRLGFPWGGAVHDVLGGRSEQGDQHALAGAIGLHEFVDRHSAKELYKHRAGPPTLQELERAPMKLFGPGDLKVIPTVGVIGSRDRSLEAHSLVDRAVKILGGEGVLYPHSAFALTQGHRKDPLSEPPNRDWENLDVLMFSAAPLQKRPKKEGAALATALPADLAEHYESCKGAVGTIYLEESGDLARQREHDAYEQVGISVEQIKQLKKDGAEVVLVNGAERGPARRGACWAALKAGLASTLVADKTFAWEVLKEEIPRLRKTGRSASR